MVERYPKTHSPFVREDGTVLDEIKEGFEWVFEKQTVKAVEKLDGRNVAVEFSEGELVGIYSREGDEKKVENGDVEYFEGVARAIEKGWDEHIEKDGVTYGELLGPRPQGNPYDLDSHIWIPFSKANDWLEYESWGNHPKTFENISQWFNPEEFGLIPLFYSEFHGVDFETALSEGYVEGVIFYDEETGKRAKLRKDMFDWY